MGSTDDISLLSQYSGPRALDGRVFCRGTAICLGGHGLLALGPSGSGKTRLALELMALGAALVSDDGAYLTDEGRVERPTDAPRLIEARGLGLLHADPLDSAPLSLIVDLGRAEPDRLPPRRVATAPGGLVPLILGKDHPFLAAAICQYLKHRRAE
ncbi:HPr kinase/phosphorylase [Nioella aestuarii]|uniref:HPr kinase/phosphorylase n=1 Tax=Nioella aestuarii TaxID=1662864 RepID=UPI003D7FA5A4